MRVSPCAVLKQNSPAQNTLLHTQTQVLIPLAARTNAVVICDAIKEIELSASFLRMVALQRSCFAGKLPFTIVAMTDEIQCLYANDNDSCRWRAIRRGSTAWAKRDPDLFELFNDPKTSNSLTKFFPRYDISRDAPLVIITDGIDARSRTCMQRGPANTLLTSLIRHFHLTLPSIAFRTGYGNAKSLTTDGAMSILRAKDALNARSPVVFLDVRERKGCSAKTRQEMIDKAKRDYSKLCSDLEKKGTMDWFNVCALAWFHDVLYGDGDARTTTKPEDHTSGLGLENPQAIHEALRFMEMQSKQTFHRKGSNSAHEQGLGRATHEQVVDVSNFIAKEIYSSTLARSIAWIQTEVNAASGIPAKGRDLGDASGQLAAALLKAKDQPKVQFTSQEMKEFGLKKDLRDGDFVKAGDQTFSLVSDGREKDLGKLCQLLNNEREAAAHLYEMILADERFHAANVSDVAGVSRLVHSLVTLDRLPKMNTRQELELLQQAWCEHDIAIWHSRRYLRLADTLYSLILVVGIATVACTTAFVHDALLSNGINVHLIFSLSMINTILILAVKFFNPTARGNQLRTSASTLESIIWQFRTRVGVFAYNQDDPTRPIKALQEAMTAWHASVVGGTDLLRTSMERKHPAEVFTHCQHEHALDKHGKMKTASELDKKISKLVRKLDTRDFGQCDSELQEVTDPNPRKKQDLEAGETDNTEPLGLVWVCVGSQPTSTGTEIKNKMLATALRTHHAALKQKSTATAWPNPFRRQTVASKIGLIEFSKEQWASFDVVESGYLSDNDCYIKVHPNYFKPASEEFQLNWLQERRLDENFLLDDHQSPMRPDQYIELRLLVMLRKFQAKIPYYHKQMSFWELVLTICTIASSALSYIGTSSHYVAVSSGTAAAVTSWVSYSDLMRKIELYNKTVRSINELIWYWKSLDDVERANIETINKLIETGEAILASERQAWITAEKKNVDKEIEGESESASSNTNKTSVRGAHGTLRQKRARVAPLS